jgi:ribosomal protein S18 acetylase RimI-like enzyme
MPNPSPKLASKPLYAVETACTSQKEKLVATLTLAFITDPMSRWSMPDPETYLMYFPALVRAFSGNAFEAGTAYYTEHFSGAAVWLSPGSEPDHETLLSVMEKVMPLSLFAEGGAVFEQMAAFHPKEPHWYLPLIGVDPAQQGKGYGAALMRHALRECDRTHTLAYLESSNPANIPFYEQHGFQLMGKIQSGSSPNLFPMQRKPQ